MSASSVLVSTDIPRPAVPRSTRSPLPRTSRILRQGSAEEQTRTRILIADDDEALRATVAQVLGQEGYEVVCSDRGDAALELAKRRAFDVAFVDLFVSRVGGLTLMRALLEMNPRACVVIMTRHATVEASTEALQAGAWDFLPKPFSAAQLQVLAGKASQGIQEERKRRAVQPMLRLPATNGDSLALLGCAPGFQKVIELANRVAHSGASVFITGESGSGKELIAQFIHEQSPRSERPFVAVNCGAIPEALLESEMFGHRKGAFTGAVRDKPGLLEAANGGTLFLDELPEMPTSAQSKLLRVIQDGAVRRVGSEVTDTVVDVRFISATNRDPAEAVERGVLREDLYYRLCVVRIHVPALRERPEDIPLLADHFLRMAWRRRADKRHQPTLSDEAVRVLCARRWRGNIRELHNVIEHVAAVADAGTCIEPHDLPLLDEPSEVMRPAVVAVGDDVADADYHSARDHAITEFESGYVKWLLERADGNLSEAARIAGVARTTLYLLLERVGWQRRNGQRAAS